MFFRRWRQERRIIKGIRRQTAPPEGDPWTPHPSRLGEVELICLVVRILNFESILAGMELRALGAGMIRFYGAVADAILEARGDVNQFHGAEVIGHFNVLYKAEEASIVESAMKSNSAAQTAFDQNSGATIGVGLCRGVAIAGAFGSTHRITHTAFGPSAICAEHLAREREGLSICEEFAEHFSRPQIPSEPWISIVPHWKAAT